MKIVVLGGTGLIGSRLVSRLAAQGHHAVAASPATGVDAITGVGLTQVLAGTEAVVDVTNARSSSGEEIAGFFRAATTNLLAAEESAGVAHHVALSVSAPTGSPTAPTSAARRSRNASSRRHASRTRSFVRHSSSSSST